jgi:hypothetical protein
MAMDIHTARVALAHRTWEHPSDYGGFSPDGDYLVLSTNRDADSVTRSNWECAQDLLRCQHFESSPWDDDYEERFALRPVVYDFRAGHWAVGWVEYMLVRKDAPDEVLIEVAKMLAALEDYPVLDEDHLSNLEWDEACEAWKCMSLRERVEICGENRVSIFAARRDEIPLDDTGSLFERLRGY